MAQYKPRAPHFIHQMRQLRTLAVDFTTVSYSFYRPASTLHSLSLASVRISPFISVYRCRRAHIICARRRRRRCQQRRRRRCRRRRRYIHTNANRCMLVVVRRVAVYNCIKAHSMSNRRFTFIRKLGTDSDSLTACLSAIE